MCIQTITKALKHWTSLIILDQEKQKSCESQKKHQVLFRLYHWIACEFTASPTNIPCHRSVILSPAAQQGASVEIFGFGLPILLLQTAMFLTSFEKTIVIQPLEMVIQPLEMVIQPL